jgi:DNA repair protein RecN (Recombination protein N)
VKFLYNPYTGKHMDARIKDVAHTGRHTGLPIRSLPVPHYFLLIPHHFQEIERPCDFRYYRTEYFEVFMRGRSFMLEEIRIRNFAIIDQLELSFADGLNVITGETGAGKSIIIDAVELLLGGKTEGAMVRAGAEKATVEGDFALDDHTRAYLLPILEREELLDPDASDVVTIGREVRNNGRSAARINGVTVAIDILQEIGAYLVDVHGQSEHLSLLKPAAHLDLLDRYANLIDTRAAVATLAARLREIRAEIKRLMDDEAALKKRAERLRDDIEQIDAAALSAGEDDELRAERTRLSNSEQLARLTSEAFVLLYGDDRASESSAAVDALHGAAALLQKLMAIDPARKDDYTALVEAVTGVEEVASSLRDYAETVEYNPDRLEEVEERLEAIRILTKRFGATIPDVLKYADDARAELDTLENSEARIAELQKQETALLKQIGELSERISRSRKKAADKMGAGIVRELADLRMESARFEVGIEQVEDPTGCYVGGKRMAFDDTGIDQVEFMMSANPGEPLRPLAKVASGGEAARIMLALKRVLTQADHTPTLIFDEIDQGIGGRVGSVVGEKLWGLTSGHQVLVVTHLAQLAGYADQHYRVAKRVTAGRTTTEIVPLGDDAARVEELAAMLGTLNDSGRQSARELLTAAAGYKAQRG